MLAKSRAADSGVKLEVNGKILDSCTELMRRIRKLVQKSRLLQTEIVAQGKVSQQNYINRISKNFVLMLFLFLIKGNGFGDRILQEKSSVDGGPDIRCQGDRNGC